ncbi:glycosyltransferase family 2 protein [Peribacillus sp. SCS-155]|uniref:glycosyltransferase family 2 protein n=1 Tax=Peribacillus sedimenti TaxID=3115297 RepID=UPI003906B586
MGSASAAIILLNWNSYQDTYECLKSLEFLTYPNYHVFVVDNASSDDSFIRLKNDQKTGQFNVDVTFIKSERNLGCAGGNNVGFRTAYELGFDYYWMLNTDTYVEPDALCTLIGAVEEDQAIGIVGSKILYARSKCIWFAGGRLNPYLGTSMQIGIDEEDCGQYDEVKEVDFIVGCSMLFRRELIQSIGYLDEDYFVYYEDTDWNLRAKKAGWKIVYVPSSIVYHKETAKKNDLSPYYAYYLIRNGYLMVSRVNAQYKGIAFVYLFVRILLFHRSFVRKRNDKLRRSAIILKGAIHALTNKTGQYVK